MKTLGKIGISAAGLAMLIWGGTALQQHFKRQGEIKAKLEEAVGRDAGYTETILKMEKDSSHITYGEFFDLCDKSVEQRTTLIVELRGLYPAVSNATKDKLIDYLNAENDTVRAKRDLYRKQMQLSSAMDTAKETIRDSPYSEYGWDFYRDRVKKAREQMVEAAKNLQGSAAEFADSYQKTLKVESSVADEAARSGVRFKRIFKDYNQSNIDVGKQSADEAAMITKST